MNYNSWILRAAWSGAVPMVIVLSPTLAWAQFDTSNTPDMSRALSTTGNASSSAASGRSTSGLEVPAANPGRAARAVGQRLQTYLEGKGAKEGSLTGFADKVAALVPDLEAQLEKNGFQKRDLGVAAAFAVIFHYETATGITIPDEPSRKAARAIAVTLGKQWQSQYAALSPSEKERQYETLLCEASLLSTLAKSFTKAGKTAEANLYRQNASALFTRLTGKSPDAVAFTDDGRITGLGTGGSATPRTTASNKPGKRTSRTPPTRVARRGTNNPRVSGIALHFESGGGVGGGSAVVFSPYVLLADGRIARAPDESIDQWDATADQRKEPTSWGRWRRSGKTLNIVWGDGKTSRWEYGAVYDAKAGTRGMKLNGLYTNISGGGTSALGGDITTFVQQSYTFSPNGTFVSQGTAGSMSGSVTAGASRKGQGRYQIDGWTITLTMPDGSVKRGLFYRFPDSDDSLGIFGSTYSKD